MSELHPPHCFTVLCTHVCKRSHHNVSHMIHIAGISANVTLAPHAGRWLLLLARPTPMSILLGTNTLPSLFAASVLTSILAQPISSQLMMSARTPSSQGVANVFRAVAIVLLGFAMASAASSMPTAFLSAHALSRGPSGLASESSTRRLHSYDALEADHEMQPLAHLCYRAHPLTGRQLAATSQINVSVVSTGDASTSEPVRPQSDDIAAETTISHERSQSDAELEPAFSVATGQRSLSAAKRALLVTFYLWMGTQNLVCVSVLWARSSDVFPEATARRVFGILSAAATGGQLLGAFAAGCLGRAFGGTLPVGASDAILTRPGHTDRAFDGNQCVQQSLCSPAACSACTSFAGLEDSL